MTTAHNHPPHCCCGVRDGYRPAPGFECPACSEHGELAQLGKCICGTPGLNYAGPERDCPEHGIPECSTCHQPAGRPHTDYCHAIGIVGADPRDHTTIAAGQTSTPTTHARDTDDLVGNLRDAVDRARERRTGPPRTPGYDGPEGTEWPRLTTDPTAHTWGQDTHYPPEGQGFPHHISQCGPARRNCPPRYSSTSPETGTPCPDCQLTADHKGGCPATGQAPQPGAPG